MPPKTLNVTINGTGFAAEFTAGAYGLIPHQNGVDINLAGVCSGRIENARKFAEAQDVDEVFESHSQMIQSIKPDIDNIVSANHTHGPFVIEAAQGGAKLITLEKPPVIWPGYAEGREASAEIRKRESMEYLATVLDAVRANGTKLLYAENFIYVSAVFGMVNILEQAMKTGKGKILHQSGVCAHQGSHAPVYDTPAKSGGGALFNKACHPLGTTLYLKQIEGLLRDGRPIRPARVSALALQILKHQPESAAEHFRVMENVDDFSRITVIFEDQTVAEVYGSDLCISGIRSEVSVTTDFAQYDMRINPHNGTELFMPDGGASGNLLFREKLPTTQGTSYPIPRQALAFGHVGEIEDAVACVLDETRYPQSGPMMAWDSMAVLMAAYESAEKDSAFVDISEYVEEREFDATEMASPDVVEQVFQTM
jgi:predicted dehydrogenase